MRSAYRRSLLLHLSWSHPSPSSTHHRTLEIFLPAFPKLLWLTQWWRLWHSPGSPVLHTGTKIQQSSMRQCFLKACYVPEAVGSMTRTQMRPGPCSCGDQRILLTKVLPECMSERFVEDNWVLKKHAQHEPTHERTAPGWRTNEHQSTSNKMSYRLNLSLWHIEKKCQSDI